MCAINPKHQMHFTISVYTSIDLGQAVFESIVAAKLIETEAHLNDDMRLRWHISDGRDKP